MHQFSGIKIEKIIKNLKRLNWVVPMVKITLKMMERKIIQYFNQFTSTLNRLQIAVLKLIESIKLPTTSGNNLIPRLDYIDNLKIRVKFNGSCLKLKKATFTSKAILNFYIEYKLKLWPYNDDIGFTFGNYLFDAVKLTETADSHKYSRSEYCIGFNVYGNFLQSDGSEFGKNATIYRADNSYSGEDDNRKRDILILGKFLTVKL